MQNELQNELLQLIKCHEGEISHSINLRDNDVYFERRLEFLTKRIEKYSKELESLVNNRENANDVITASRTRIKELKLKLAVAINTDKIERFKKITKDIEELKK